MCRLYVFIFFLALLLSSCSHTDIPDTRNYGNDSLDVYISELKQCFSVQDYDKALTLSYIIKNRGQSTKNNKALLYGYIYLAQYYGCTNVIDSMNYYFDKALPMAEKANDNWALATIFSFLGGNAAFGDGDYFRGMAFLIEGLRYAESIRDTSRLILVKSNLAMASCFIHDSTGLTHARDIWRIGQEKHDNYTIFIGAITSANLYWMTRDTAKALQYIKEAIPYVEKYDPSREVYVLYANILRDIGKKDSAVIYYEKAFDEQSGPGIYSKADLYLGYSEYLKEEGRFDDAINILLEGLRTMDSVRAPAKKPMIYLSLSEIYEYAGDYRTSLRYYKEYNNEANKQLNIESERKINNIRRDYTKQKHEVELLEWRNKYNIAVMTCALVICIFVGLYLLYRNKERNYRQLLKQHQALLERNETQSAQQAFMSMPQEKMREMYEKLEKLMQEQELYRQNDLSRDKVASMLSTNRTYLCSVIKLYTGMSFTYYVNSFRINEAVRILSDPANDSPIKAIAWSLGYNNLTTFYRLFEAAKGMPPSKYRETVIHNANLSDCKR